QEHWFEKSLGEKKGFVIKKMKEDGACLFRAVDPTCRVQLIRCMETRTCMKWSGNCMDYLMKNADYFSNYVTEDFTTYINRKRKNNCHGNHIEMQAMAEMYNRPVEVYQDGTEPINTFHGIHQNNDEPIRGQLPSQHPLQLGGEPQQGHIGVGWACLPSNPGDVGGVVDRAADVGGQEASDGPGMATNEAIEEQVARGVYLQCYRTRREAGETVPNWFLPMCTASSERYTELHLQGCNQCFCVGRRKPRKATATCSSRRQPPPADRTTGAPGRRGNATPTPPTPALTSNSRPPPRRPTTTTNPPPRRGPALTLSKPPSPCAPGNTHTHTHAHHTHSLTHTHTELYLYLCEDRR
ncbi:hypothetical protein KUCAC02_022185, partial [Chaenocephalus aceratus]